MAPMRYLLLLTLFFCGAGPLLAQKSSTALGETELDWQGIVYQLIFIKHISPDRLLVGVRLLATDKASPGGTLIGFPATIPKNANKFDVAAGYYHPRPLSLASSTMTDNISQQSYPVLASVAPPGKTYRPGVVLASLSPGQSIVLTVQFAVPPPPPVVAGQPPVTQTVSFLFTNAKLPISKIPLPPETK